MTKIGFNSRLGKTDHSSLQSIQTDYGCYPNMHPIGSGRPLAGVKTAGALIWRPPHQWRGQNANRIVGVLCCLLIEHTAVCVCVCVCLGPSTAAHPTSCSTFTNPARCSHQCLIPFTTNRHALDPAIGNLWGVNGVNIGEGLHWLPDVSDLVSGYV